MLAISLWQPWASAIACDAKCVETRGWPTKHRGPLLIHAAKRCVQCEIAGFARTPNWNGALEPLGWPLGESMTGLRLKALMPFGGLVAIAELIDCKPTESFDASIHTHRQRAGIQGPRHFWTENQMGDFTPGRFGWVLANVRPLKKCVPFRGAQGLFEVADEVFAHAL